MNGLEVNYILSFIIVDVIMMSIAENRYEFWNKIFTFMNEHMDNLRDDGKMIRFWLWSPAWALIRIITLIWEVMAYGPYCIYN